MTRTSRLGVGVIGLGIGQAHAAAFGCHPDCRIAALCDIDPDKLAVVGRQFPSALRLAHPEDLIAHPDVSIVVVASPDDLHYRQILAALRAGKHVFAEKPVVIGAEQARDVRAALRARPDLRLTTNTILRRSPRFRELRAALSRGDYGDVFYVEADYNYGRLHKLTEGWRGRIADYSVMLGGGIHMIDLVLWLTGQQVIEVSAMGSDLCGRGSGFAGDDLSVALLRFKNGALAKVGANFGCVEPHFHRLTIYGTRATFENARGDANVWESRDAGMLPRRVATAYPGMAKGDMVPAFVDAILGRGEPDVDADEAFAALAVAFAIDQSKRARTTVAVDYF